MEKKMIIPAMTKKELHDKQMEILDMFLDRGAITKEQYDIYLRKQKKYCLQEMEKEMKK